MSDEAFTQQSIVGGLKTGTIKIDNERYVTLKGNIRVQLNQNIPSSGTLLLPVFVIKAKTKKPDEPVFWFQGGPGISNMKIIQVKELLNNHDLVAVGYRGVDGSVCLNSKEIAKATKGLHNNLLSDESLDNLGLTMNTYLAKLKTKGIDINCFTMMDVIDDMEYARKAMNYDKINLLSTSYGTRLALYYSYRYPNVIHRSVMVGANPPGHFKWEAEKTEEILNIYDSLYREYRHGNNQISLKASMKKAFENIPSHWSFFTLDVDKIKSTTFLLLFQKQTAVMAFDAYIKASEKNDYSGLYLMQLAYDYMLPGMMKWGEFFEKGASADYVYEDHLRESMRNQNTTLGANLCLLVWGAANSWNQYILPQEDTKLRNSETETLIISGNLDVSTPSEFAKDELLPTLSNGHQVILNNMSHVGDLMMLQPKASGILISTFFNTGIVDQSQFIPESIDFKPKMKFTTLAKVFYPVVAVMSILK